MKPVPWSEQAPLQITRQEMPPSVRRVTALPPAPALNTVLAVREHAPAEIVELESEIRALNQRLTGAHARKRLLESLLATIRHADAAVMRQMRS